MRRNHPNSTENKDSAEEEEQPTKFDRNNNKMWKGRKKKTTNICSSLHHSCHSRHLISCHLTSPPKRITYIHTYIHNILYFRSPPVFSLLLECACAEWNTTTAAGLPTASQLCPFLSRTAISFHSIPPHTPKKILSIRNNYCGTKRNTNNDTYT